MTPAKVRSLAHLVVTTYPPEIRAEIERAARIGIWRLPTSASIASALRTAQRYARTACEGSKWTWEDEDDVLKEWCKANRHGALPGGEG